MIKNNRTNYKQYDSKVFHNAKVLLKIYRDVVWQIEGRFYEADAECFEVCRKHLSDLADYLIDTDTLLNKDLFEEKLRGISISKAIVDAINKSLELLKLYPRHGEDYYNIIYLKYIIEDRMTETEILDKLNLEKSTFYRKKRDAINKFSIALWGYMLPLMHEALMEQYQVENTQGIGNKK